MTLQDGVQERLEFVAQHIGILPYGFSGNASHYNLGSQEKRDLMDTAVAYGYDESKSFEEMFEDLMAPLGYEIGTSITIYNDGINCTRHDHVFITVRRGYEHLSTIRPEHEWPHRMRYNRPRCGLCGKRERCEFFQTGLLKPKAFVREDAQ